MHQLVSTEFNFLNENMEMICFKIFDNHLSTLQVFQNVEIILTSCCLVERWLCRTHEIWRKNERVIQIVCYYLTNIIEYLTTNFYLVGYIVTTNSLYFLYSVKNFPSTIIPELGKSLLTFSLIFSSSDK